MKKFIIGSLLVLAGCNPSREVVDVIKGKNGSDGSNGANGHSIVSMYQAASELECEVSGSRLDMYIDTDDNLVANEGDVYSNSLVVCNGANGLQGLAGADGKDGVDGKDGADGAQGVAGEQGPPGADGAVGPQGPAGAAGVAGPVGPQGPAGPQGIQGPAGASATIVSYYGSSCQLIAGTSMYMKASGSNAAFYTSSSCHSSTKVVEISQGESYWASSNALAVWSGSSLRVITFN